MHVSEGQLYAATVADFSGGEPLIHRDKIRTERSDLNQLNGNGTRANCIRIFVHEARTTVEFYRAQGFYRVSKFQLAADSICSSCWRRGFRRDSGRREFENYYIRTILHHDVYIVGLVLFEFFFFFCEI